MSITIAASSYERLEFSGSEMNHQSSENRIQTKKIYVFGPLISAPLIIRDSWAGSLSSLNLLMSFNDLKLFYEIFLQWEQRWNIRDGSRFTGKRFCWFISTFAGENRKWFEGTNVNNLDANYLQSQNFDNLAILVVGISRKKFMKIWMVK